MAFQQAEIIEGEGSGNSDDEPARVTRAQATAAKLRDMIAQNILSPGARIRERAIADELKVSRTPMREALRILAAEHLIEIAPNRGAIVSDPAPEKIRDLLSVLGALESLAGEQAARNATPAEIAEIRALHFEMLATYEREDRLAYFKLNQAIHRAIVTASKNEPLMEVHQQVNARLYRVRYQSNLRNKNWRKAIEEHEAILDLLSRRDGGALAATLRAHLQSTWQNVSHGMQQEA